MTPSMEYAELYRSKYQFEQEHQRLGGCNLIHVPRRAAGSYTESPVVGPSLQISLRARATTALLDLGAGRFRTPLTRPTFVVGPPGVSCSYDIPEEVELLIVEFNPLDFQRLFTGRDQDLGRLHAAAHDDRLVIETASRLWAEGKRGLSILEGEALTLGLAALVVRTAGVSLPIRTDRGGLAPWQIRRCTEILQSDVSSKVSLAELASEVGLSPFHFARAFKHSTGLPPHTYQLKLRVERAKALLVETNLAITDVAFAVGYESCQALARLFQREVGATPTEYRRACRD